MEIDELRTVVGKLVAAGKLEKNGAQYQLTSSASKELTESVRESSATEAEAFADWEIGVEDLVPGLSGERIGELRDDLHAWLQHLLTRFGVEAALVLYPEEERARRFLGELEEISLDFLPNRDQAVEAVRPKALYSFIHSPTPAQRIYLANLLTTGYLVAVFTLDPKAQEAVQSLTKGQRVYLDTNLVYAILNLSGPRAYLSVRRVLQMTQELGYEVCVTPWTVAEMKYSVRRAREKLARTTLPPRALAEIAAEASGDETFITAYWRKYKETGVSSDDFLDLHEHIEPLLEERGIEVCKEACLAVDRDEDGLAHQVGLLEMVPGGRDKPRPVQEHDAKHRQLVERLRGEGNRRFSNAGYWFLTRDRVLVPYAAIGRERPDDLAFAVSLTAWAHVVRSLCPRTEDYEQTLVDLLDTPSVRPRGMVSYATVAEVLGRIEMLVEDSTEEVATRMMLDGAVMEEVEARDGNARSNFIDAAIEQKKAEMEHQLRETKEEVARERSGREAAERREREKAAALEHERVAREEAERDLQSVKADHEQSARAAAEQSETAMAAAKQEHDNEAAEHSAAIAELRNRVANQERLTRFAIAGVIAVVGVAVLLVFVLAGWVSDGWPLVGVIAASVAAFIGAIAWAFGRKRAASIALVLLAILGGVAAVQQIVSSDDPPPKRGP